MATLTTPKLSIVTRGDTETRFNLKFKVHITPEEYKWLAGQNPAEVQAICAIYGKDPNKQDQILFSFVYDMDKLESVQGAKQAVTGEMPVSCRFKIPNDDLDEDEVKQSMQEVKENRLRKGNIRASQMGEAKKVNPSKGPLKGINARVQRMRLKRRRDMDEVYAVVYLSIQKTEEQAWEAITPSVMSNVVSRRF